MAAMGIEQKHGHRRASAQALHEPGRSFFPCSTQFDTFDTRAVHRWAPHEPSGSFFSAFDTIRHSRHSRKIESPAALVKVGYRGFIWPQIGYGCRPAGPIEAREKGPDTALSRWPISTIPVTSNQPTFRRLPDTKGLPGWHRTCTYPRKRSRL